ncbi:MAG: hypothetical protein JWR00_4186 [Rubritepida sp.]|nr:hypothetical protein [Rubritepida sp.]
MAHPQQQIFIGKLRNQFPDFFQNVRVLEIGSLDINGSIRTQFRDCDYIGLDLGPGPGVDVVAQGQDYDGADGSFDTVLSCETMEHNPFWKETFENMARLCRPGGLVIMTCASTGRREHGTRRTTPRDAPLIPWDYYRNLTARDLRRAVPVQEIFSSAMFCRDLSFNDLFFAGFRAGSPPPRGAAAALRRLRNVYLLQNLRNLSALRAQFLMRLVGEERYLSGPLLRWRRKLVR